MPIKSVALGLSLVCLVAGIVMIAMSIGGKNSLLIAGLALVVVGLGAGASARASKG